MATAARERGNALYKQSKLPEGECFTLIDVRSSHVLMLGLTSHQMLRGGGIPRAG